MNSKSILCFALVLILLLLPANAAEPLRSAWKPLVPGQDVIDTYKNLTSYQKYEMQMKKVRELQKKNLRKKYTLRLRCIAIIESMNLFANRPKGLALLHGQYVDQEYRDTFGKDATIGIWTEDFDTIKTLKIGDEFYLTGKIIYVVHHINADVDQVKNSWRQQDINTSVAYLNLHLTGFPRRVHICMVNAKIEPIQPVRQKSSQ